MISVKRPGIAIGLLICMYGIESFLQSQSTFFVTNSRYVNLGIVGVMLVAVGCSFLRNPNRFFQLGRIQVFALILYLFGYLSFYWTLAPEQFHRWRGAFPFIVIYMVLGPILTREEKTLQQGLKWSLIIGVPLLLLIAFYCEWGNRGILLAKALVTSSGIETETRPLAVATLGSLTAIIALVAPLRIPLPTLFRFSIMALGLFVAFMTESRGQVVAIIGVAAIVYPVANRATNIKGLFITLIGVCIFGAIVFYLVNNLELIRWRQDKIESAMLGRKDLWFVLLSYWTAHMGIFSIIGFGACSCWSLIGGYPHNLLIELFVELGLIGITIYTYILLKSASTCLQLVSRLEDFPKLRGDVIALIGLIGVTFALSLKEGSLYNWPVLFFFLICLDQQLSLTHHVVVRKQWLKLLFLYTQSTIPEKSFSQQTQYGNR